MGSLSRRGSYHGATSRPQLTQITTIKRLPHVRNGDLRLGEDLTTELHLAPPFNTTNND